jgi:hypothetical protein
MLCGGEVPQRPASRIESHMRATPIPTESKLFFIYSRANAALGNFAKH